jgi:chemotaxis protein MotB
MNRVTTNWSFSRVSKVISIFRSPPRVLPCMLGFLLVVPLIACETGPASQTLQNENKHLHGVIRSQERRIDDLSEQRNDLERRVSLLEVDSTGESAGDPASEKPVVPVAVENANPDVSAEVQQMLERFKSDSDIEVEQTKNGYRFVMREKVLFGTSAASLSADGRLAMQRVADALRGGTSQIQVEGHTDNAALEDAALKKQFPRGSMEMSVARAMAVWEYLVGTGKVAPARASVSGRGSHQPRVPNDSERNRYRNRRVEILVSQVG